jgi:hypothetical protein
MVTAVVVDGHMPQLYPLKTISVVNNGSCHPQMALQAMQAMSLYQVLHTD